MTARSIVARQHAACTVYSNASHQDDWPKAALERQWLLFVAAVGTGQYAAAARIGEAYAVMAQGRAKEAA